MPSNRQEKLWFVEQTPAVSHIDDLKNTPVQRKRLVYDNIRGEEIVNEDVQAAVNNLSAFYAGLPEFAGNTFDLVEGGLPTVRVLHLMLSLSLNKSLCLRETLITCRLPRSRRPSKNN